MSKVKVKALTLTNSQSHVKSDNQKMSEDYKNYIFRIYRKMKFLDIKFMIF